MKGLFVFRGFLHDPQGILTAVYGLALVGVELLLDSRLSIPPVRVSSKLPVATFTDSEHWYIPNLFHDPKIALLHGCSLAHLAGRA